MRLFVFIILISSILSYASIAQECDYKVEILSNATEFEKGNLKLRIRAIKVDGVSTNLTGIVEIRDFKENIIKTYEPWANEPISKQKTSNEYSPNLALGQYKITSRISVECRDTNKANNMDAKWITITEAENKKENKTEETIQIKEEIIQSKECQLPQSQEPITYESSNEKAKNLIIFFLLGVSVLLNIVLIWKR